MRHQSIFSPRLINESTFGFTNFPERDEIPDSELTRNQREPLGYKFGQFVPSANPLNLLPAANFGGVPNAANLAVERRLPQAADQGIATIVNNVSYNRASHLIKAGFYLDLSWRDSYNPSNFNGLFDFVGMQATRWIQGMPIPTLLWAFFLPIPKPASASGTGCEAPMSNGLFRTRGR